MSKFNGSEHFTPKEVECRCGCGFADPTPELIGLAEKVRKILGVPMHVNSCCRCRSHNGAVGGSPNSKHLTGDAMDFHCWNKLTPIAVYNMILSSYIHGSLPELGGMGLYKNFVHIDTYHAADGHLRLWRG